MFKKALSLTVVLCFFLTSLGPLPRAHADSMLNLPAPGTMINLSPAYQPVMIKGLTVHKNNPFLFDFIVDIGQDHMSGQPLKNEGEKLIKYFLASLAIPDKDVWVNLSPYEKNKIIPDALGQTDMGRDLLEQDYILKQMTASLIYPEKKLGQEFWNRIYAKAQQMYGVSQVPVDTFNKVWIVADRAEVFEHNQTAFVVDQHLKVMLEEDYLALTEHRSVTSSHTLASQVVRQIILPELEKEVNTGKNFANLRQIFNSVILASWYKRELKQALLSQMYANRSNVRGVIASGAKQSLQQIYTQYLQAYKKGVFNYIREDVNNAGVSIPRKYFSGGIKEAMAATPTITEDTSRVDAAMTGDPLVDFATLASTQFNSPDHAMGSILSVPELSLLAIVLTLAYLTHRDGKGIKPFTKQDLLAIKYIDERTVPKAFSRYLKIEVSNVGKGSPYSYRVIKIRQVGVGDTKEEIRRAVSEVIINHPDTRIKNDAMLLKSAFESFLKKTDAAMQVADVRVVLFKDGKHYLLSRIHAAINVLLRRLEGLDHSFGQSPVIDEISNLHGHLDVEMTPNELARIYRSISQESPGFIKIDGDGKVIALQDFNRVKTWLGSIQAQIADAAMIIPAEFKLREIGHPAGDSGTTTFYFEEGWQLSVKALEGNEGEANLLNVNKGGQRFPVRFNDPHVWDKRGQPDWHTIMNIIRHSNFDRAMSAEEKGGIDLNTSNGMQWKLSGDGVQMNIDPAMIARIEREGIESLSPVILRITPVVNVRSLVGV